MKKHVLILVAALSAALSSWGAVAGAWKVIPMSGTNFSQVVDSPDMLYYVSDGSLYSYDKSNNETRFYQPGKHISGAGVRFVKYNVDARYLLCVYADNNIDIIYDNGRLVNMPEIKDSNITGDKTVNSVSFDSGRIYVATAFGIVIYDEKKHLVIESGVYNKNIKFVQRFGDHLVLNHEYFLYTSPANVRHNTFEKFTKQWNIDFADWEKVADDAFICMMGQSLNKVTMNIATGETQMSEVTKAPGATGLDAFSNGYYCVSTAAVVTVDRQGGNLSVTKLPAGFGKQTVGMWSSPASIWAGDERGIANYDISQGAITVLSDKYFPEGSKQLNNAFAVNSYDGKEVFFNGIGCTGWHPSGSTTDGQYIPCLLESYNWNTGKITPRYPVCTKNFSSTTEWIRNQDGRNLLFGGSGTTVIDPVDTSYIYHANNLDGLIVIKDRKALFSYNETNSPLKSSWKSRTFDVAFDPRGNLWVSNWLQNFANGPSPIKVIIKDKLALLRQNPQALTEKNADGTYKHWLLTKWVDGFTTFTDGRVKFVGNTAVYIDAQWEGPVVTIDTKGTDDVDDDTVLAFYDCEDQDGNIYKLYLKTCMVTDQRNQLWIGTSTGVHVVRTPSALVDGSTSHLSTVRPKVSRNDGTNYADYLLTSDNVLCMAVDNSNRKWIGTEASGLYLVNEDGTEILQHFNTENSPITTNCITMLACDPAGNDVMVGTKEGIFIYSGDATPGADDFSAVYAYPNPVRPDYTGWITVNGLMSGSLVKIADIQGNVLWSGRSEGGMVTWDGCDASGSRVPSGVYLVLASKSEATGTEGVATKIVVVN